MLIDCSIYYPVVGIGYLTARYGLFDRLGSKLNTAWAAILIPAVILARTQLSVIKGFTFDVFYAPILILAFCRILDKCRQLHPLLMFLGKYSFHMWLFHSIFFSTYTRDLVQPLVDWTSIPILRFVLVTFFSAVAAVLIDRLWNTCTLLTNRLWDCFRRR